MRTSDCDILIIPGFTNSGPDHWQSRWERQLSTARRVEQASWDEPKRSEWVARVITEVKRSRRPVVLVAHSLAVGPGVNPFGDEALERLPEWWSRGPCVDPDDPEAVPGKRTRS